MNLIVCVDDKGGMSFFGRRQSMDVSVREKALALVGEGILWMDAYTAGQFQSDRVSVIQNPEEVPEDGWYFFELGDIAKCLPKAKRLALFRWNRLYPADQCFPVEKLQDPVYREDFPGKSHETITLEVYSL